MLSPTQRITSDFTQNLYLDVKREDLIHKTISGNKWRKLKYNIKFAKENKHGSIITFGGAFSNHIHATAAACNQHGLRSIGIIRGEYDPLNPTLQFALAQGMKLIFVDRAEYREKENGTTAKRVIEETNGIVVPEGGSNFLAMNGLKELSEEINETDANTILVSAGTGCTAAGIAQYLDQSKELWVFASLKHALLNKEILGFVDHVGVKNFKVIHDYHLGGYAKTNNEYISFLNQFTSETQIPLDPVYNGKLMYGFVDMLEKGMLDTSKKYLWVHTGGLQGIDAYNYMAKKKGKFLIE